MQDFELILVFLFAVALIATASRLVGISYPILMVIGGLLLSLVPWLPRFELEPEIVLAVFLPPILFSAAYFTSVRDFWLSVRPITLLAFGLVLATTVIVAVVAHALVPDMPWPVAFALGAIVSPPDAIAVTAIAQRLGMPRRLVTILEGESLVNDATALVAWRFAVAAAATGSFSLGQAAVGFAGVVAGGLLIGVAIGALAVWIEGKLHDPPVETLISLLAPFAAYLPAESIGVSGVLATVTAGIILGWRASRVMTSDTRVLASGVWQMVIFSINGLAFLLIGLQLPEVIEGAGERSPAELAWLAAAISVTVVVVRLAWVFPATYIPRWVIPGLARRDPSPSPRTVTVLGWAGMRGAVSLAAALALPRVTDEGLPFPYRDLVIFLAFAVILVTLVGQGLTLPWLMRRLGVGDDGSAIHEEVHAREEANAAALARLDELADEWPGHLPLIDQLRDRYTHLAEHYTHDHDASGAGEADQEAIEHRVIHHAVIDAQRVAVIELRDRGIIHDDAMRKVERDLDFEELQAEG